MSHQYDSNCWACQRESDELRRLYGGPAHEVMDSVGTQLIRLADALADADETLDNEFSREGHYSLYLRRHTDPRCHKAGQCVKAEALVKARIARDAYRSARRPDAGG